MFLLNQYIFKITGQTGQTAPEVNEVYSNLKNPVTWQRMGRGVYCIESIGGFPLGKTQLFNKYYIFDTEIKQPVIIVSIEQHEDDELIYRVFDAGEMPSDFFEVKPEYPIYHNILIGE